MTEPRTSAGSGRSLVPDSRTKGPPSGEAVPTGFVVPSFRAVLPVRSLLANIPSEATVKSFYVRAVLRDLSENGHPMPDVVVRGDFNDYPTRAAADLLLLTAERLHGDLPQREALRRIGWTIFPALLDMTIGRVVYGALGKDIHAIAQAAPRASRSP